jgi:O-antigen chain-terminating methyltransferase
MSFLKRVRTLVTNLLHINKTTYEVYKAKERIQELTGIVTFQKSYLQELQEQITHTNKIILEQQKQLNDYSKDHKHFKKQHAIYEQTHNNTEHKMYHFVQKHLLAQSLIFQQKLQPLLEHPQAQEVANFSKTYLDAYYVAFENKFRGSRQSILKRYEEYYRFVPEKPDNALDIGCGRAEWVEILQSKNIQAHGVDLNTYMLEEGRANNVQNLHEADAIEFLRQTPSATYDLITAYHIIEHLQFQDLLVLLSEIKRVAKPNATILLETPNPANLQVAATHFYNDPTHLNPLPHRVVEFMLEYLGFHTITTHHINPYAQEHHLKNQTEEANTLNRYLYQAQDYLVEARA